MPYELNLSLRPHQHLHYTDIFLFAMLAICGIIDVDLSICIDMFISITYNAVHSFNIFTPEQLIYLKILISSTFLRKGLCLITLLCLILSYG